MEPRGLLQMLGLRPDTWVAAPEAISALRRPFWKLGEVGTQVSADPGSSMFPSPQNYTSHPIALHAWDVPGRVTCGRIEWAAAAWEIFYGQRGVQEEQEQAFWAWSGAKGVKGQAPGRPVTCEEDMHAKDFFFCSPLWWLKKKQWLRQGTQDCHITQL